MCYFPYTLHYARKTRALPIIKKGCSIFFNPLCGTASPALTQPAAGAPLPRSRLRLSPRGCHGEFATRACTFAHARGAESGGCACRRAAIIGHHRRGGACRHNSATPRHFPPCLPFLVRLAARWVGRACRLPGRVRRGAGPSFPSHPPPPLGQNKGGRGEHNPHLQK